MEYGLDGSVCWSVFVEGVWFRRKYGFREYG